MIRIIRHISVRFWLTSLMVLPSGFILFPRLSGWFSDMPGSVFMALMYVFCGLGLGIFMDIAGLWRIRGLVRDAQLWERSGIAARAEKKFIRAIRIYDSAWISPLAARRAEPMLISSLARFYLASGSQRREIQGAASAWLAQNPKDESLARFWLERIQDQDVPGTSTQSILTALADNWYADPDLCRILVGVFLDQGRMDFSARRLYRSFLDITDRNKESSHQDKAWAETIRDMMPASLDAPEPNPEMQEPGLGILGDEKVDLTTFTPGDQEDDGQLTSMGDQTFEDGPAGWRRPEDEIYAGQQTAGRISALMSGISRKTVGGGSFVLSFILYFILDRTGKAKYAVLNLIQTREKWWGWVRGIMIACLGVWLTFFVWGTVAHMFKTAEQPAQQIKVVIPKPFTIQVAAYNKKKHADKYMATLAQKGLETFIKVTDGGGKTWYLVRVSEFTDQKSAQSYGNRLKAGHIIDEFFVTQK